MGALRQVTARQPARRLARALTVLKVVHLEANTRTWTRKLSRKRKREKDEEEEEEDNKTIKASRQSKHKYVAMISRSITICNEISRIRMTTTQPCTTEESVLNSLLVLVRNAFGSLDLDVGFRLRV